MLLNEVKRRSMVLKSEAMLLECTAEVLHRRKNWNQFDWQRLLSTGSCVKFCGFGVVGRLGRTTSID